MVWKKDRSGPGRDKAKGTPPANPGSAKGRCCGGRPLLLAGALLVVAAASFSISFPEKVGRLSRHGASEASTGQPVVHQETQQEVSRSLETTSGTPAGTLTESVVQRETVCPKQQESLLSHLRIATSAVGPKIPGSALVSAEDVLKFRARWDCITTHHGSWIFNPNPRPIPVRDEIQEVPKNQVCRRQINNSELPPINDLALRGKLAPEDWNVPDSLKYEWQVDPEGSCGIPQAPGAMPNGGLRMFDGVALCEALGRIKEKQGVRGKLQVFVVGDSLSAAFMSSIEAQMKLTLGPKGMEQLPPEGICAEYTKNIKSIHPQYANYDEQYYDHKHYVWHGSHCAALKMCHRDQDGDGDGVMVHFGRTMHLSWLTASEEAKKLFMEEPWEKLPYAWADEMVEKNASVAVISTGHFHQPLRIFQKRLNFTLTLLRQKLPHLLLIYRSTCSAHLHCMAFKGPIDIPRSVCGAPYNWGEFAVHNKLARRIVESVGGVYMDVFTMSELRPDWHLHSGDCLHYCAPGPIDVWAQIWMNMLMELS